MATRNPDIRNEPVKLKAQPQDANLNSEIRDHGDKARIQSKDTTLKTGIRNDGTKSRTQSKDTSLNADNQHDDDKSRKQSQDTTLKPGIRNEEDKSTTPSKDTTLDSDNPNGYKSRTLSKDTTTNSGNINASVDSKIKPKDCSRNLETEKDQVESKTLPRNLTPNSDAVSNTLDTSTVNLPIHNSTMYSVEGYTTLKQRKNGKYEVLRHSRIRNNLLISVGFLELANAADFAANVWNQIPVPNFAKASMALGGSVALLMSFCAFKDASLSFRNVRLLREERFFLKKLMAMMGEKQTNQKIKRYILVLIDTNFRELGMEVVERFAMDMLMGCGSIMVGVGTILAIGGQNRRIYDASNLLSGYIGNSPSALYGVVNAGWSVFVLTRAYRHSSAVAKASIPEALRARIKARHNNIKIHAVISGLTGLIAAASSLITATRWWGYIPLIPCIISSIYINYLLRNRLGYDRPVVRDSISEDETSLIQKLKYIHTIQEDIKESPSTFILKLVPEPNSFNCNMNFIVKHGLFESFCLQLANDKHLPAGLLDPSKGELTIQAESLLKADQRYIPQLLRTAQEHIASASRTHFQYQERYFCEVLGCFLSDPDIHHHKDSSDTTLAAEDYV